jgi:hypothetical protein
LQNRLKAMDARDPALQNWLDAELRAFGKDPRGLVAPAIQAWAQGGGVDTAAVVRAFGLG